MSSDPEPTPGERAKAAADATLRGYAAFNRFKIFVVAWFVRLMWPLALLSGLVNAVELLVRDLPPVAYDEKAEKAVLRTVMGGVLFLIWLFCLRRRGRFTLNRDGVLED